MGEEQEGEAEQVSREGLMPHEARGRERGGVAGHHGTRKKM